MLKAIYCVYTIDPDISPKMELRVQLNRRFISLLPCYPLHHIAVLGDICFDWLNCLLDVKLPHEQEFSPNTRTYHKSFIVQRNGKGRGDWVSQEMQGKALNLRELASLVQILLSFHAPSTFPQHLDRTHMAASPALTKWPEQTFVNFVLVSLQT